MKTGPFTTAMHSVRLCPECNEVVLIVFNPGPKADAEFEEKLASHQAREHA